MASGENESGIAGVKLCKCLIPFTPFSRASLALLDGFADMRI